MAQLMRNVLTGELVAVKLLERGSGVRRFSRVRLCGTPPRVLHEVRAACLLLARYRIMQLQPASMYGSSHIHLNVCYSALAVRLAHRSRTSDAQ